MEVIRQAPERVSRLALFDTNPLAETPERRKLREPQIESVMAGNLQSVMRDLDVIDDGFPVLAGSIGPSHGYVHVIDIGTPVNVFGMRVEQGELMHADRHGALVIPEAVIDDLADCIEKVVTTEAIVLGPAREPGFDIKKLEKVWAEFEASRT